MRRPYGQRLRPPLAAALQHHEQPDLFRAVTNSQAGRSQWGQ